MAPELHRGRAVDAGKPQCRWLSPVCLAERGDCRSHAERAAGVGYWHPRPTCPSAVEGAARKLVALAGPPPPGLPRPFRPHSPYGIAPRPAAWAEGSRPCGPPDPGSPVVSGRMSPPAAPGLFQSPAGICLHARSRESAIVSRPRRRVAVYGGGPAKPSPTAASRPGVRSTPILKPPCTARPAVEKVPFAG